MRPGSGFYARAYLLCAVHNLFINIVNVPSRLHISGLISLDFDSKMVARATQRDVCVVIVQCSRPEDVPVAFIWLMISMLLKTACDTNIFLFYNYAI